KGAWAGEIGQTQLLATRFLLGATDWDGGGIDVYRSAPDALATTANWFKKRAGNAAAAICRGVPITV
ncbi:MAG: lytic murein transglycosylase, partial [Pseudomonadota bacterium]